MTTTDLFDLTGKVALLTGASKGMGKSMAMGLAVIAGFLVVGLLLAMRLPDTRTLAAAVPAAAESLEGSR